MKEAKVSHTYDLTQGLILQDGFAELFSEALVASNVSCIFILREGAAPLNARAYAQCFSQCLEHAKVSHTLDLGGNWFTPGEAEIFAQSLQNSKVSFELILRNNKISCEGALFLARGLEESKHTHTIDLTNNAIEDSGLVGIINSLMRCKVPHVIKFNTLWSEERNPTSYTFSEPWDDDSSDWTHMENFDCRNDFSRKTVINMTEVIRKGIEKNILPVGTMICGVSDEIERLCRNHRDQQVYKLMTFCMGMSAEKNNGPTLSSLVITKIAFHVINASEPSSSVRELVDIQKRIQKVPEIKGKVAAAIAIQKKFREHLSRKKKGFFSVLVRRIKFLLSRIKRYMISRYEKYVAKRGEFSKDTPPYSSVTRASQAATVFRERINRYNQRNSLSSVSQEEDVRPIGMHGP